MWTKTKAAILQEIDQINIATCRCLLQFFLSHYPTVATLRKGSSSVQTCTCLRLSHIITKAESWTCNSCYTSCLHHYTTTPPTMDKISLISDNVTLSSQFHHVQPKSPNHITRHFCLFHKQLSEVIWQRLHWIPSSTLSHRPEHRRQSFPSFTIVGSQPLSSTMFLGFHNSPPQSIQPLSQGTGTWQTWLTHHTTGTSVAIIHIYCIWYCLKITAAHTPRLLSSSSISGQLSRSLTYSITASYDVRKSSASYNVSNIPALHKSHLQQCCAVCCDYIRSMLLTWQCKDSVP